MCPREPHAALHPPRAQSSAYLPRSLCLGPSLLPCYSLKTDVFLSRGLGALTGRQIAHILTYSDINTPFVSEAVLACPQASSLPCLTVRVCCGGRQGPGLFLRSLL